MKIYYPYKSDKKSKKFYIITINGDRVYFGQAGAEDFTIHKDEKRREAYRRRHEKNEDWTEKGINTAGWWSWHYLWSYKSKRAAYNAIKFKYLN